MTDDADGPHAAESWTRGKHGVQGIPPCRRCRAAMTRIGAATGLQLVGDHWQCPGCGWELRLSYGRGSV